MKPNQSLYLYEYLALLNAFEIAYEDAYLFDFFDNNMPDSTPLGSG